MDFRCYHCESGFTVFSDVIKHTVDLHAEEPLKIRVLSVHPQTGKPAYARRDFNIVPLDLLNKGQKIVGNESKNISVVPCVDDVKRDADAASCSSSKAAKSKPDDTGPICEDPEKSETNADVDDFTLQLARLQKFLPDVALQFEKSGFLSSWVLFHELVCEGLFDFENIAFHLFMDLVRFIGSENTTAMRYGEQSKLFWRTGYKLFHGKFLRFMGGPKSLGQIVDGSSGSGRLVATDAKVNFAVPTVRYLDTAAIIKDTLKPGIIEECIESVANKASQVKISFDGKKINASLSPEYGDVNLFGFEDSPTFQERQQKKHKEIHLIHQMVEHAETHSLDASDIHKVVQIISLRIKDLREMECVRCESLKKFKQLGAPDWRKSKYAFVVSSLQSSLFEIKETILSSLDASDRLCKVAASIQGASHLYCIGTQTLDLTQQENYICLTEGSSHDKPEMIETDGLHRCIVKQRSEAWFKMRKSARVTGSQCHRALGLNTLKEQVGFFDEVFMGKEPTQGRLVGKEKHLQHGIDNEIHAMTTLVGKVLPAYIPGMKFVEEGCVLFKNGDYNFLVVSPDGSGRSSPLERATHAFEFKCPYFEKKFVPQVHYKIPHYYVPQLLAEMAALQCSKMLFVSYTEQSSTVFLVEHSEDLWQKIWDELTELYGQVDPKRPSKTRQTVSVLKEAMKSFTSTNVNFLCEVPSLKGKPCSHSSAGNDQSPFQSHNSNATEGVDYEVENITVDALQKAEKCVDEAFNLCRKRASEIFIFMASDLDRMAGPFSSPSLPIAYGLQGPSLKTQTTGRMLQHVLEATEKKGLEVLAFSCDGQWINLITKDFEGKPLTQIQHQKTFWELVGKMPKQTLLQFFNNLRLKSSDSCAHSSASDSASLADVAIKKHHQKLFSGKKSTDKNRSTPEDVVDFTSNAIGLLPSNLTEKVDDATYQEIVGVVKTIIKNQSQDTNMTVESAIDPETEESMTTETGPSSISLDAKSVDTILAALQSDEQIKDNEKWKKANVDLKTVFTSTDTLDKSMSKCEVKICLKTLKQLFPKETSHVRLSSPKYVLMKDLLQLLGKEATVTHHVKHKKCSSLKDLALKQAKRIPKPVMCALYAELKYPQELAKWKESFPYSPSSIVNGEEEVTWFSFPSTRAPSKKKQSPLFGIVDSHHILTNLRTKCCSSGISSCGIQREAWIKIARSARENKIGLTQAHVEDLIDRQSNANARLTFSEPVESEMRLNGDENEANLCRLIREWYDADDEPGQDCLTRIQKRLRLRSWLLSKYNGLTFPPPGSFVCGIPVVTFESLVTNIERKIQIYSCVKGKTYNSRSLSTLDAENFFSVLGDLAPGGSGLAIRPADIPNALKTACEISMLQMDPNKPFHMHTSRAPVYPKEESTQGRAGEEGDEAQVEEHHSSDMSVINARNHQFDLSSRKRTHGKRKSSEVSGPMQPSKGAKGVRQYHKTDESKILPHVRAGVPDP